MNVTLLCKIVSDVFLEPPAAANETEFQILGMNWNDMKRVRLPESRFDNLWVPIKETDVRR